MLKERNHRRRTSPRCLLVPGKASDYIKHAMSELQSGDKVILCCRVSETPQKLNGNLNDQDANLRYEIEELDRNITVLDVRPYEGSGFDPFWIARVVALAKKHGAKLLAESTDRFIRHPGYHSSKNPNAQARKSDLEDLRDWADGVTLVTILHPDASPEEVRSYQRKRGQRMKGNRGGRPKKKKPGYKKQRRIENLARVLELKKAGYSNKQISKLTGVARTTLRAWIRKYCEGGHFLKYSP